MVIVLLLGLAVVPVHDKNIIEEGVCFGAEPANICSASSHYHQPQPNTCMHSPYQFSWSNRDAYAVTPDFDTTVH